MLAKTTAVLTDGEANALENAMPANAVAAVGRRMQEVQAGALHVQKVTVDAAANATPYPVVAEVSGEIVDITVQCTVTNASGSLQLRRSTTSMGAAVACATVDTIGRATTIVQAQKTITQGEALNILANGAADRGIMFIAIRRS